MLNSFLMSKGFPKQAYFNPDAPTISVTELVNHVFKQYFNLEIHSMEYVAPVVETLKNLFQMGKNRRQLEILKEEYFTKTITETVNIEVSIFRS
jgi:hypothetical protein